MFACNQLKGQEVYIEIVNSGGRLLSNLVSKKALIERYEQTVTSFKFHRNILRVPNLIHSYNTI